MLRFDGHLKLARPLAELATVLDMTGLALSVTGSKIVSNDAEIALDITRRTSDEWRVDGTVGEARAEVVLQRLAMAFESDGIDYELTLYDADGLPSCRFEPTDRAGD
jgi:hypothetical protein